MQVVDVIDLLDKSQTVVSVVDFLADKKAKKPRYRAVNGIYREGTPEVYVPEEPKVIEFKEDADLNAPPTEMETELWEKLRAEIKEVGYPKLAKEKKEAYQKLKPLFVK
jgi:hypothetical protein